MSLLDNPFDPAREAALVTGAGNGIGRAIAQALTGEGVRTVFADISEERVTAAIKDRRGRNSPCPGSAISPTAPRANNCWRMHDRRSGWSRISCIRLRRRGARPTTPLP